MSTFARSARWKRCTKTVGTATFAVMMAASCSSTEAAKATSAPTPAPTPAPSTPAPTTSAATTTTVATTTTQATTTTKPTTPAVLKYTTEKSAADSPETLSGYNFEYPKITDGPKGTDQINAFIADNIGEQLTNWASLVAEDSPESQNLPDGATYFSEQSILRFESPTPDLVVWVSQGSEYTGGAHPNPFVSSYAFSALTGELVFLDTLLSADALPVIEDAAKTQLSAYIAEDGTDPADVLIPEGYAGTFENYNIWWPTDKGLNIQFSAYQVGPYAIGMPEVLVPWADLNEFISDTSLLRPLVDAA
jgi:hypothetical protein